MSDQNTTRKAPLKPVAAAVGAVFATSLAYGGAAQANTNPFSLTDLGQGYQVASSHEGQCAGNTEEKGKEGECAGKTEQKKETKEGECAAKKEGGEKGDKEGKCGEGKCGSA